MSLTVIMGFVIVCVVIANDLAFAVHLKDIIQIKKLWLTNSIILEKRLDLIDYRIL